MDYMPVDAQKLYKALKEKGTSASKFSREIGWAGSYVKNSLLKNKGLRKSIIMLLKAIYNIDYDDIKSEEVKKEKNTFRTIPDDKKHSRFNSFMRELFEDILNKYTTASEIDKFMLQLNYIVKSMDDTGFDAISEIKSKLDIYGKPVISRNENGMIERKFVEVVSND